MVQFTSEGGIFNNGSFLIYDSLSLHIKFLFRISMVLSCLVYSAVNATYVLIFHFIHWILWLQNLSLVLFLWFLSLLNLSFCCLLFFLFCWIFFLCFLIFHVTGVSHCCLCVLSNSHPIQSSLAAFRWDIFHWFWLYLRLSLTLYIPDLCFLHSLATVCLSFYVLCQYYNSPEWLLETSLLFS